MGVIKFAAEAKATIRIKGKGFSSRCTANVREIGKTMAAAAFAVINAASMEVIRKMPKSTDTSP